MRTGTRAAILAVSALLAAASIAPVSAASGTTTRWVDDDGTAGPASCGGSKQASTTIQAAIDKSDANDVVIVCPGVYTGTIGITGARDGLTVRGSSGGGSTVLKVPKSHDADSVVWVEGVSNVTIQWLTVSFPSTGCAAHVNDVNGLFAEDANGLRFVANQFRTAGTATQGACGYQDGIRVLSSSRVLVQNNVVRDFQSDGISFEDGTRGLIKGNAIHFYHGKAGSDSDGDQGIRIEASRAEVTGNVVRSYPGSDKPHTELGIVVMGGSGTSDIHHNKVWYTKTGIGVIDSTAKVRSNDVFGVRTQRGIHVVSGTGSQVLKNRVQQYGTGIQVDASGTVLRANDARGNLDQGCVDTTSGSGTAGTANTWSSSNVGSPASSPSAICSAS